MYAAITLVPGYRCHSLRDHGPASCGKGITLLTKEISMIVTLALVVLCLRVGSVEENDIRWSESRKRVYSIFEDNSHMNRMWESKCRLTQVEQHIHDYKRNGSMLHLPRLRDLKARYPGDTFTPTRDNACDDINPKYCEFLAKMGQCTGSDSEVTLEEP